MKIIDKIDKVLSNLEIDLSTEIVLHEANAKVGGKEYDDFFKGMLSKWKVKSYKDLPKDKQGKFFDAVDKDWNSKVEKGKTSKKYRKGQSSMED